MLLLAGVGFSIVGCSATHERLIARIDASLAAAAGYLIAEQSPDGPWRSKVYGVFRDGPSLTPTVLTSLYYLPHAGVPRAFDRGVAYMEGLAGSDAKDIPLAFPVYTAAAGCWLAGLDHDAARGKRSGQAWLRVLNEFRLGPALGWSPQDPQFGGWGYSTLPPEKPRVADWDDSSHSQSSGLEGNISATLFGIGGLRAAGVPLTDPAFAEILLFVTRCQNYAEMESERDDRFDDGGFFFTPADPARNKAGPAGMDRLGRTRFHSYGSTTADGVRALIQCGLPLDHPRVLAARTWLERNFSASSNPGVFEPQREMLRDSYYYYYAWSVAHALRSLRLRELNMPAGRANWARLLATELMSRQLPNGAWSNRFTDAREDDPLVATPLAAAALMLCRRNLTDADLVAVPHSRVPAIRSAADRSTGEAHPVSGGG